MSDSISQYFNKNESHSFGYKIYIRNETSHTHFSKAELVYLKELKEQGLVLEIPQNICQKGHSLTLFFVDKKIEMKTRVPDSGALKESSFHALVKVESVEEVNKEKNSVIVDLYFTQFDGERWTKILEVFSLHQAELTQKLLSQHKMREEK